MGVDSFIAGVDSLARRYVSVAFVPLASAFLFLLALRLAGAPRRIEPTAAWQVVSHASTAAIAATVGALAATSILLYPLQLQLVRILEGYWPRWLNPLITVGRASQMRRWDRLANEAQLPADLDPVRADELIQRAGQFGALVRKRFPGREELMPTALGNALSAAEEYAGAAHGWDLVVFWPRLYLLLPQTTRTFVDDRRNRLDAQAASTAAFGAAAATTAGLTATTGWWVLLTVLPLLLSTVAYRGAVVAAIAYGEALAVAVDLHRFELYDSLHLPRPRSSSAERELSEALALEWRQGDTPEWTFAEEASCGS